mmetsp:Transcript_52349/g.106735  ORF Transcript_52349/g.106735 Transcript_52349/m.106735 type:complete len:224 (-) Transcript_52349:630-1301(-)
MGGIHGSADGYRFIRVDPAAELLVGEHLLKHRLHLWNPRGPSHQQHLINVFGLHPPVHLVQRPEDREADALEEVRDEGLEVVARHLRLQCLVLKQLVETNIALRHPRQVHLQLCCRIPQLVECFLFLISLLGVSEVHPRLLVEHLKEVVNEASVNVFPPQPCVPVRRSHLEVHGVGLDLHDGDIEGAAAEVEDQQRLGGRAVSLEDAKGKGSSSGLIDDAFHL